MTVIQVRDGGGRKIRMVAGKKCWDAGYRLKRVSSGLKLPSAKAFSPRVFVKNSQQQLFNKTAS